MLVREVASLIHVRMGFRALDHLRLILKVRIRCNLALAPILYLCASPALLALVLFASNVVKRSRTPGSPIWVSSACYGKADKRTWCPMVRAAISWMCRICVLLGPANQLSYGCCVSA